MATDHGAIYIATESGSANVGGQDLTFIRGVTRVREGHALLEQAGHYFEPMDLSVHYEVEDATAEPGTKRGGRRAKKADEPASGGEGQ